MKNCHIIELQKLDKQNQILQNEIDKMLKSTDSEYLIDGIRTSNASVQKMFTEYKKNLC